MRKIVIDADGCPVTRLAVRIAKEKTIPCTIVCDTSHVFDIPEAKVITVEKGADSADFRIVNLLKKGDIVITQDYGLAAMCLARGAFVINQDGRLYTEENIGGLLEIRAANKKSRMTRHRIPHIPKRDADQNRIFETELRKLLEQPYP